MGNRARPRPAERDVAVTPMPLDDTARRARSIARARNETMREALVRRVLFDLRAFLRGDRPPKEPR